MAREKGSAMSFNLTHARHDPARAVPNPFFKPVKTHASVRIDADVMAWLKSQGKGYQTRINAILREAMLRSLHHKT